MADAKKVLIVDDDLVLRQLYTDRLQTEGYKILTASNGEEGLEAVKNEKPDVIILDIMMPKMNGIDVLKNLRSQSETKDIPVIVLTALLQQIKQIEEVLGPKDSYLMKSEMVPADVVKKIQAALGSTVAPAEQSTEEKTEDEKS